MASSPATRFGFERAAHAVVRHRYLVIASWVAGLLALVFLRAAVGGSFADSFTIPGSEAQRAADLLAERFPARAGADATIVFHSDQGLNDAATRARIEAVLAQAAALPDVVGVSSPFTEPDAISPDGRTAFATVRYPVEAPALPRSSAHALVHLVESSGGDGLTVEAGGQVVAVAE